MGMPPGLPFFGPQLGAPQIGGSAQNNRYPAPGLQPYPSSKAALISEGLSKFMTSYFGTKEAIRQHYEQRATDALMKIQAGLLNPSTVDQKKIVQWMKRADWPIRTEAPTPAEQSYNEQQGRADQAQRAQMALLSGGAPPGASINGAPPPSMGPGLQQAAAGVLGQVQPPSGPAPTPPSPGFLQRLGIGGPPASVDSPAGQYIQQLTAAAQAGAPLNPANVAMKGRLSTVDDMLKGMNQGQQAQVLNMTRSALDENDPRHNDSIIALGKMGMGNVPLSELMWAVRGTGGSENDAARFWMYGKMGGPQMLMKIQDVAKELLPRVGGDWNTALKVARETMYQGYSTTPTSMTMGEAKDQADGIQKLLDNKPTMPQNLGYMLYQAQSGNPAYKSALPQLLDLADKYPNAGTIKGNQWQQEQNLRTMQFGLNQEDVLGNLTNRRDQLALNTIQAIGESGNKEYQRYVDILKDPNSSNEARMAALQGMSSVNLKQSQVRIPIPGAPGQTYQVTDPTTVLGALHWYQQRYISNVPPYIGQQPGQKAPGQSTPQPSNYSPGSLYGPQAPQPVPGQSLGMPQMGMGWNEESNNVLQYLSNPQTQAGQNWLKQQQQQQKQTNPDYEYSEGNQ